MSIRNKSIFLVLSLVVLLCAAWTVKVFAANPSGNAAPRAVTGPITHTDSVVQTANHSDISPALRTLKPLPSLPFVEDNENPMLPRPRNMHSGVDTVVQRALGPLAMPAPIQNFDGMYNENGPIPPDTNGEVGRNHYVQIVNSQFAVYSKTGTLLYGPANNYTLFSGFGGICEATNNGDPIVNYDQIADRWVISQFAFLSQAGPTHQCFAVSTSPDPLGSYYRYDFTVGAGLEDYPHVSVWPDAYYMITNTFNNGANTAGNFAFNRAKMLVGDPSAEVVIFRLQGDGGLLSSDFDGSILPPAGSPAYFFELYNTSPGQLAEFKFHVDFTTPANSTFTGPFVLPVADFTIPVCGASRSRCIPQPGTTALLEALDDRLMFRVAYRNFGGYESIVLNHTVNNGSAIAAPRWYELRNPNGATGATVFQQGTYSPADGVHRWVGSIAQDRAGDIAMGFSASSSTLFPSIRYAGRLPADPVGTFGQGEATLLAGGGSEDFLAAPRWGDYSDMTIDPVDDCTFWFTTEYFAQTGLRNWRTRIGSFKFPSCTAQGSPTPVASPTGAALTATPIRPTITPCAGYQAITGSITNTDGTQTGRLGLGGIGSTCAVPKTVGGISDTFTRHYDSYTYTNSSGAAQCVTVSIVQNCGDNAIQSVTYLGTYDPTAPQTNYLADGGASGHSFSYSFNLAAGATAVIVVVEVSPNLGCATYNLTINPCAQGAVTPSATTVAATPTRTAVLSPSATPTVVCVGTTYQVFPSTGATMIPATNNIGNNCDDCITNVTLPFPVTVYGTPYTAANVGSNGDLLFASTNPNVFAQTCPPVASNAPPLAQVLFAYFDDLRTDVMTGTHGIFTSTTGTAPNRDFAIRWQATYFDVAVTADANFEVVLHENSNTLSVIYGTTGTGANPGTGIQLNLGQYSRYLCGTDIPVGTRVDYVPIGCGVTPSPTPVVATATPTRTTTPVPTDTPCPLPYTDVSPYNPFFVYIRCLYCRGALQGYGTTFGPYTPITRGEVAKITSLALGYNEVYNTAFFTDVPTSNMYFQFIERLRTRNILNGYNTPSRCPTGIPCFLPDDTVTRGQLAKIEANGAGFNDVPPANSQSFTDVPPTDTFWIYIQRLARRGIISGYDCGSLQYNCATGAAETCTGANLPYYRPCANITRGQTAKVIANTFFPISCAPGRLPILPGR